MKKKAIDPFETKKLLTSPHSVTSQKNRTVNNAALRISYLTRLVTNSLHSAVCMEPDVADPVFIKT